MSASTASQRPYLVFIRCGAESLHRRLLAEDPERRWDCCVSWYIPPVTENLADFYHSGGDNKLEGFLHFRAQHGSLERYRYVLLLDDDVYFRPGDVSRFLDICDRHSIFLAQPALRWSTNYNLRVTLHNPACELRRVSFVEVMAPCFRTQTLEELLPTLSLAKSTWGVDVAWASLLHASGRPLHVVDAVQVEHTKPFDPRAGAFYRKLLAMGVDPYTELERLKTSYPIPGGRRTMHGGHVYRSPLRAFAGRPALIFFEALKKLAQLLKPMRRIGRVTAGER